MAKHKSFLGRRRVLNQSPFDRPRTSEDRRKLNPRVAAVDKWRRIEALQRLKSFLSAYREAWLRFAAGVVPLSMQGRSLRGTVFERSRYASIAA